MSTEFDGSGPQDLSGIAVAPAQIKTGQSGIFERVQVAPGVSLASGPQPPKPVTSIHKNVARQIICSGDELHQGIAKKCRGVGSVLAPIDLVHVRLGRKFTQVASKPTSSVLTIQHTGHSLRLSKLHSA